MKYVDLGLPSGTLWAAENEEGGFYTYEQAMIRFGDNLPSKERFEELKSVCRWTWNGSGYIVAGPNGNNIVLPAAGYRDGDGNADYVGMLGSLWSSTPDDSDDALFLYFDSGSVDMVYSNRCYFRPIRLVKKKGNNMKNKKLNLVEILKDCPKGTELYTPMFGKVRLLKVDAKDDDMPISVELQDKGTRAFTSDGRYSIEPGGECVLFPSKDNRDWESFHVCPNFKKGDFVARVHDGKSTILLMGDTDWSSPYSDVKYICYLNLSNDRFRVSQSIIDYWCTIKEFYEQDGFSLATDDEKKKLLDAIDKHGYVWNEENLELRKKDEKPKFNKGDIVVRVHDNSAPCILMMGDTDWSSQDNPVRFICYKDLNKGGRFNVSKPNDYWYSVGEFDFSRCRPATNLEKYWLMITMNKHGYVWDEENLELRKKEYEFEPYERVLARNEDSDLWMPVTFGFKHEKWYGTSAGYFLQCIPYKGNENLGGTAQKPE